jgi:hypothetical protein
LLSSICSTIAEDWKTSESLSCDESCQTKKKRRTRQTTKHLNSEDQRLFPKFYAFQGRLPVASPACVHVPAR